MRLGTVKSIAAAALAGLATIAASAYPSAPGGTFQVRNGYLVGDLSGLGTNSLTNMAGVAAFQFTLGTNSITNWSQIGGGGGGGGGNSNFVGAATGVAIVTNTGPTGTTNTLYATNFPFYSWGTNLPEHKVNVTAFGAACDLAVALGCNMTNGTAVVGRADSLNWQASDVGKSIVVVSAGAGGNNNIQGVIQSIANGTNATLNVNAQTTVNNVLAYYGTDDTAADQAAIDAQTNSCAILFPAWSFVGGPLNASGGQLTLPAVSTSIVDSRPTMVFEGISPAGGFNLASNVFHPYGSGIWSGLCNPSVPDGGLINVTNTQFEPWIVGAHNFNFFVPPNPPLTALMLSNASGFHLDSYRIGTGQGQLCIQPTNWQAFAIFPPWVGNNGDSVAIKGYVNGFNPGIGLTEHLNFYSLWINSCSNAFTALTGGHADILQGACVQECVNAFGFIGALGQGGVTVYGNVSEEQYAPYWPALNYTPRFLDDPLGAFFGRVEWAYTTSPSSVPTPTNVGAAHIQVVQHESANGANYVVEDSSASTLFDNSVQVNGGVIVGGGGTYGVKSTNSTYAFAGVNPVIVRYDWQVNPNLKYVIQDDSIGGGLWTFLDQGAATTNLLQYQPDGNYWAMFPPFYLENQFIAPLVLLTNGSAGVTFQMQSPMGNQGVGFQMATTNNQQHYYEFWKDTDPGQTGASRTGELILFDQGAGQTNILDYEPYLGGVGDNLGFNFRTNTTFKGDLAWTDSDGSNQAALWMVGIGPDKKTFVTNPIPTVTTLSNLAIAVSNNLLAMGTTYSNATGYPIIVQGGVQFNTGSGVDAVCYFVHTNWDGLGWQTNYLRAEGALASDSFLYPFAFTLGTNATWFFTDASTGGASTVLTNMRVTQITGGGGIATVSNNVTLGQTYPMVNMTNGTTIYTYPYFAPSNTGAFLIGGSSFNDPSGGFGGGKPFNFLTNMPLISQMTWITNAALSGKGITNALYAWTNTAGGTVSSVSNLVWTFHQAHPSFQIVAFLEGSVNNLSGAEQDPQTGANFLLPNYSNDVRMLITNMQSIGVIVAGTTIVPRADGQVLSDNYTSNYFQFNEFLSQYSGVNCCADWGRIAGGNCQDWNFFASNNPPHMTVEGYKALGQLWEQSLQRPVPVVAYTVTPAFQGIPWIKDYTSGWQQYGTNGILVVKDDYGNLHYPMMVNGTNYAEPNNAYVPYGTTISGQLNVTAGNGQTATTVSIVPFGPNSGSGPTDKQVLTYNAATKSYFPSNVPSGAGLPTFSPQFNSDGTQTNLNTNQTFLSLIVISNLSVSNITGLYGLQGTNRNSQGYQITTGTTSGSLTLTPNVANTNGFSLEAPASYTGPWLMQWKSNSTPVGRMDAWGSLNLSATNYANYFYWSNAPLTAGTGISLSTSGGKTTITATGGGGGSGFTGNPNQQASDGTYTNIIIGALLTNTVTRGPTLFYPQTNSNPNGMYKFSGSNEYWFRTNFVNFAVTGTSNMLLLCTNFFPTNAGMMSIRATLAISDNTQRDIASGPCLFTAFLTTAGGTPTVQATFVNTTTIYLPGGNMTPSITATNNGFIIAVWNLAHTSDILNGYADFDITMVGTNTYFPAPGQNP